MTANSLVGGFYPATSFEAYDSTGVVTTTTTALGMRVNWNTAGITNGPRTFTGGRSFLQAHPSYTWRINTTGITNTNTAVLMFQQSTFNNGTVTYEGAGQSAGTPVPCLLYTSPSPRDS